MLHYYILLILLCNHTLFIFQDLTVSLKITARRDRVKTVPSALPKMIRMSARARQGSRAPRVPKTSRNVRRPSPVYTDNASTRTDHTRKS